MAKQLIKNSCVYRCQVMHHRLQPKQHRFVYGLFMFYLDLDELPAMDHSNFWLFKIGRLAFYQFREKDYLPLFEVPLKERVSLFLKQHKTELGNGRVMLLTHVATLGYLFNPVSFYFCFDEAGQPLATVAEVTNTFYERKAYFIPLQKDNKTQETIFSARIPKNFYVSPFSDLDLDFDFKLKLPDEKLQLAIDDWQNTEMILKSTLTGEPVPLTDRNLALLTLRYPLLTFKVIALIHWEAFRLFLKGLKIYPKSKEVLH